MTTPKVSPRAKPAHWVDHGPRLSEIAELVEARDRRATLDIQAMMDDPNVALGLSPPPHRSALARRTR
jgi:hypothetical protein